MEIDIEVTSGGSVFLVRPLTDAGRDWLHENVESEGWQWLGDALAVEHRYIEPLVCGMVQAGLEVC